MQLGLAFIFSAITVYIRDIEYIISIFMQLMFYLCPIVYDPTMIPSKFMPIFRMNPMFHIISFYRVILYEKQMPNLLEIFKVFIACIVILIFENEIFKKMKKRFAEEL